MVLHHVQEVCCCTPVDHACYTQNMQTAKLLDRQKSYMKLCLCLLLALSWGLCFQMVESQFEMGRLTLEYLADLMRCKIP